MNIYDGIGNRINIDGGGAKKRPWLNIAHQGTAPNQYGNSIYSFNRSHEMGFDGVETDARLTADNVVVLSHDAEVTGTDAHGTQQTLRVINSTYEELAALTLFTIDGIDYHILKFDEFIRMAFNWNWIFKLDFKSQANTSECMVKCSEIVRNNGMIGRVIYLFAESGVESILQNDPMAMFDVGAGVDIPTSGYANVPLERLWLGITRNGIPADPSTLNRNRPTSVSDVGADATVVNRVFEFRPNLIQWTGDTDGVSLTDIYLSNLSW